MANLTAVAVPVVEPSSSRRGRRWPTGDFVKTFALVVAWQAVMTVFGDLVESSLHIFQSVAVARTPGPTPLSHTYRWDGTWYESIVEGWYHNNWMSAAFYPLFPLCVWLVKTITFGKLGFLVAGLLVNTLSTWLGVTALLKIARHFLASRIGPWLVVAAFLTSAGAFFLHMFYSEAVFIALAFWAYLFALRRQWVRMGLCLTLLTASHITAVLFIGLCFLEFWRSKQWRLRGLLSWHVLWFPASVLGFAAYALYLYAVTGDALAMFKAYHVAKDWSYQVFDPNVASTLAHEVSVVWNAAVGGHAFDNLIFIDHLLPLASLVLLLASSVYVLVVLRGRGVPLGVFGLLSFVMFTLNSNVVSGHRHVLPCVVLYIALVLMSERRAIPRAVTYGVMYVGALFQGVLVVMFVSGTWAG